MTKSRGLRVPKGTRPRWVAENQGLYICHCGCGQPVQLRPEHYPDAPKYIHAHNQRVTHRRPRPDPAPCACGCGSLASIGKRYITGHNARGVTRSEETRAKIAESQRGEKNGHYGKPAWNRGTGAPLPEPTPCACGCGELATSGRLYVAGHNGRGRRLSNYTGRYVSTYHGYAWVHVPGHPFANKEWVREHRIVVEQHLREADPHSDMLIVLGENLYLSPEIVVHHINGVKDDNRLENLAPMTNAEHVQLHHDQGDIHAGHRRRT